MDDEPRYATGGYISPSSHDCDRNPCDHVPAFLSAGCVYPASMVERHGADLVARLNTPSDELHKGASCPVCSRIRADRIKDGRVDIDDYIDEWHESDSEQELHDYLGLTIEEYGYYVLGIGE